MNYHGTATKSAGGSHRMAAARRLADLPNQAGFQFMGIAHDGEEHRCSVGVRPDGMHFVEGAAFASLAGWRQLAAKSAP